jgi:hypothetical protein
VLVNVHVLLLLLLLLRAQGMKEVTSSTWAQQHSRALLKIQIAAAACAYLA